MLSVAWCMSSVVCCAFASGLVKVVSCGIAVRCIVSAARSPSHIARSSRCVSAAASRHVACCMAHIPCRMLSLVRRLFPSCTSSVACCLWSVACPILHGVWRMPSLHSDTAPSHPAHRGGASQFSASVVGEARCRPRWICVRACLRACVRACVRACMRVCVRACG